MSQKPFLKVKYVVNFFKVFRRNTLDLVENRQSIKKCLVFLNYKLFSHFELTIMKLGQKLAKIFWKEFGWLYGTPFFRGGGGGEGVKKEIPNFVSRNGNPVKLLTQIFGLSGFSGFRILKVAHKIGAIYDALSKWHNFCPIWILSSLQMYVKEKLLNFFTYNWFFNSLSISQKILSLTKSH